MPQIIRFVIFAFILSSGFCGTQPAFAGRTIRVLFLGNSLTYVNDLPGMIADLAKSRHLNIVHEMYAPGGYRLEQHAADAQALAKIKQGDWDFVVLQEQSQMPALLPAEVSTFVMPAARKLRELIRQANPRTRVLFYMTMAKKNGDPQFAAEHPYMKTYAGMQQRINNTYLLIAKHNNARVAPVGMAWERARANDPSIELYADETHPNLAGTYLAACVFYAALNQDTPIGLPHPPGINDQTAAFLQKMALETIEANAS
ncbi:MAG: hypothetical protein HQL23_08825 [Candidatus Omnitrophica bacterium]|nr:hypothetical protein [Candidatus Omnitrophota bacterium]